MQNRILKEIYILSFLAASFASFPAYAMEDESKTLETTAMKILPQQPQIELPSGYKHFPVQTQISTYRNIYDRAVLKPLRFSETHVEGLFEILKNGFALVYDQIQKEEPGSHTSREKQLDRLKNLYAVSHKFEEKREMTLEYFLSTNVIVSFIAQSYRESILSAIRLDNFDKLSENPAGYIWMYVWEEFNHDLAGNFLEIEHNFPLPIIIYTNRGSKISPNTFVEQALHRDYRASLALFDITSKSFVKRVTPPTQIKITQWRERKLPYFCIDLKEDKERENRDKLGTNTDPHYSAFSGTYKMLRHDLFHMFEQEYFAYQKPFGISFLRDLKEVNLGRERLMGNNLKIITNGLYIFSHEFHNVIQNQSISEYSFEKMIDRIKKSMITHALDDRTGVALGIPTSAAGQLQIYGYIKDGRDYEFILKAVDMLPSNFKKLSRTEKMEKVREGYDKFWELFKDISLKLTAEKDTVRNIESQA
jgi:hypothetical protein